MRRLASRLAVVVGVLAAVGCAPTQRPPELEPTSQSHERLEFQSVWVAGFVVDGRPDIDVNDRAVRKLRFGLSRMTSAAVVDEPPLRLAAEPDLLQHEGFTTTTARTPAPLVVAGTVRFTCPIRAGRSRPARRTDVHELVTLRFRLVFIDGGSGQVVATKSYRREDLRIAHGQVTVYEAFEELLKRAAHEMQHDIVGGPGPVRWTIG